MGYGLLFRLEDNCIARHHLERSTSQNSDDTPAVTIDKEVVQRGPLNLHPHRSKPAEVGVISLQRMSSIQHPFLTNVFAVHK